MWLESEGKLLGNVIRLTQHGEDHADFYTSMHHLIEKATKVTDELLMIEGEGDN